MEDAEEDKSIELIIIGASAGGALALIEVLHMLPRSMPPILVVQHMDAHFTTMYAERLNGICKMDVSESGDNEFVKPGHIYIAPGNYHTIITWVNGNYVLKLDSGPKILGLRPCINLTFSSAARVVGKRAIGVILTGMGSDGASGLLEMRNAGAFTIGQNEATSFVYGMPKVAKEMGAVVRQLPLEQIGYELMLKCGVRH